MNLVLWKITHPFVSRSNIIKVTLAIKSDDFIEDESAEITVIISDENIKSLTLHQIESLAITKASVALAE